MKRFIGVKVIHAEPQVKDGQPGYKVVYQDGYVSWSPKDVFEEAYRPTDGMTLGLAVEALKRGLRVARRGWNGKGMWLELQRPDEHSKMTLPYIYIEYPAGHPAYPDGCRVPWQPSIGDTLAEDWEIVK